MGRSIHSVSYQALTKPENLMNLAHKSRFLLLIQHHINQKRRRLAQVGNKSSLINAYRCGQAIVTRLKPLRKFFYFLFSIELLVFHRLLIFALMTQK